GLSNEFDPSASTDEPIIGSARARFLEAKPLLGTTPAAIDAIVGPAEAEGAEVNLEVPVEQPDDRASRAGEAVRNGEHRNGRGSPLSRDDAAREEAELQRLASCDMALDTVNHQALAD
ncbi:MAG: hypothetical protein ACOC0P_03975, partial [Planctomycetota bacterium]